jgi:very-short-patch-repair endonuclease
MSLLEETVKIFLEKGKIKYVPQKRFSFIGRKSIDFYLPDYNVGIECQGVQHYIGTCRSNKQMKRDNIKYKECEENGIKILYYTNYKYRYLVPKKFKKNTFFNLRNLVRNI